MYARAACSRALNPCWITEARCGCSAHAHGCCLVLVLRGRQWIVNVEMKAHAFTPTCMTHCPWYLLSSAVHMFAHHAVAVLATPPACLLHCAHACQRQFSCCLQCLMFTIIR